jgi:hypothetical protein
MAEPGEEIAARAGGRGHLRAANADREQVIGVLKSAFVQGRLTKDELDLRVGRALTSRTFAELAALTADIPVSLADLRPPQAAREWSEKRAAAAVLGSIAVWWGVIVGASLWVRDSGPAQRSVGVAVVLVLLHMSIILLLLLGPVLKRRAGKRAAPEFSPDADDQDPRSLFP